MYINKNIQIIKAPQQGIAIGTSVVDNKTPGGVGILTSHINKHCPCVRNHAYVNLPTIKLTHCVRYLQKEKCFVECSNTIVNQVKISKAHKI